MKKLQLPANEADVRALSLGDEVLLTGVTVTARDAAHKFMMENEPPWLKELLKGTFIYHCGPVITGKPGKWKVMAAGPTTSAREEPYEAHVIRNFGLRGVIGKGGMGPKTAEALKECGAVYLHAVGGAATVLAERIEKVLDVHMLDELGAPEAFWVLQVKNFPAIVTMDANGQSLHKHVLLRSTRSLEKLLEDK